MLARRTALLAVAAALLLGGYALGRRGSSSTPAAATSPAPAAAAAGRLPGPAVSEERIARAVASQLERRLDERDPSAPSAGDVGATAEVDAEAAADAEAEAGRREHVARALDAVATARRLGTWTIADGHAIQGIVAELAPAQRAEIATALMKAINGDGMKLEQGAFLP